MPHLFVPTHNHDRVTITLLCRIAHIGMTIPVYLAVFAIVKAYLVSARLSNLDLPFSSRMGDNDSGDEHFFSLLQVL
jgi:hypothetical protein